MKWYFLILFLSIAAFSYWLRHINLQYLKLHGDKVPEGFEGSLMRKAAQKQCLYL
jgi:hypothetical protein